MTGMDAIAALSLACNVTQLVRFSMDVVSKCQELYREGSLSEYDHLEHMTKHLLGLRNALESPTAQGNRPCQDQPLLDLAEKCAITARELSEELLKLKINGPHNKRQIVRKSATSLWKKSSIDRIQTRLDEYRKILDSRILLGIRSVTSLLTSRTYAMDP